MKPVWFRPTHFSLVFLKLLRDLFYCSPDSKQIATPNFADLFFGVTSPNQFQGDVESFGRAVPTVDSAATIEVG